MERRSFTSIPASPTKSQEDREIQASIRAAEFASDSSVPWHKLPSSCRVTFYRNGFTVADSCGRELFRKVERVQ